MEKHVVRWSYLLCLVSFLIAVAWRAIGALGVFYPGSLIPGVTIYYGSFYKAGLMFALIAIATASYGQTMKQ